MAVKKEALNFYKGLVEKGKIHTTIDSAYNLEQIIEIHQHVETGHKIGGVVIEI